VTSAASADDRKRARPRRRSRPARVSRHGWILGLALIAPAFLLMVCLIFVPATLALAGTFFPAGSADWSFANYERFFADPLSRLNLVFTIWTTLATLLVLLIIGLGVAVYLRFSQSRLVGAIQMLSLFPLFVPGIVISFALIRFLGPTGLVPTLLKAIGITGYRTPYLHPSGAVIGLVWENIPLTVMLLTAGLSQVSNRAIEAARDVGANELQVFAYVVLPTLGRSIAVVCCLNFLQVFGSFTVPYILGPAAPQMMSIFMQRTFGELHAADAAETQAAVTFLVCLVAGIIYTAIVFRDSAAKGTLAA
jgi:ABC-type spermidine/putrescine transport system permease subunit I